MTESEHTPDQRNDLSGVVDGVALQAGTVNGGIHIYRSAAPPAPATTGDAFMAVVDALLAVPSIGDEPGRRLVLARLRPEISQAVRHHQGARLHVIELVRTCQDYDGGLDDLLRVLQEFEGDSIPVRRSAEAMHALVGEKSGE